MITINHLTKELDKNVILDDITLQMGAGKYGLLGPNGAGKTTLIRCLLNVYKTSKGSVSLGEQNPKVGYLPQNFNAFPHMKVVDCMKYFCSIKGIKKADWGAEIDRCLKMVDMEDCKKKLCRKLSGGMNRRVGIAQALLGKPNMIFLDEPTAGLDPEERSRFVTMMKALPDNMTILFSTHIIEDVEKCCEKVIVMDKGKICYENSCEQLVEAAQKCREEGSYEGYHGEATLEDGYLCVRKGLIKNEG